LLQSEQLAQNYYEGQFEKARIIDNNLTITITFKNMIYQQLNNTIKARCYSNHDKYKASRLWFELGYNFQFKNKTKPKKLYDQAISKIRFLNEVYQVAYVFERKNSNRLCVKAYQMAISKDPKMRFNYQMALLYGQRRYRYDRNVLTEAQFSPQSSVLIQNQMNRFCR
jgi:hypothetical protein